MHIHLKTPVILGRQASLTINSRVALQDRRAPTPLCFTPESFGVILFLVNHRTTAMRMLGFNRFATLDLKA